MASEEQQKHAKRLRQMVQLQNEERVDRQVRLKDHLGLSTISELYRRLVDQEAERRGIFYDPLGDQLAPGGVAAGAAGGSEKTAEAGTGSPRSAR